jgi:F-type H+-transporting ATPase subunit delta
MSELIVAHRYAKSLLDFAIEKNVVDAVYTDMQGFKETCDGSKELVLALKSPIIKHYTKLAILEKLFKAIFNPVTYSIFVIITQKKQRADFTCNREAIHRSLYRL